VRGRRVAEHGDHEQRQRHGGAHVATSVARVPASGKAWYSVEMLPKRVAAAWLALAALVGCGSPARRFGADDERAVRAVLASLQPAWNRGDLDGFLDGYARVPGLVFTSGGKVRRGWQETHDTFLARYGQAKQTMGALTFEILGLQAVGADGAVVLGRWSLDVPNAGAGVFSVILERRPEGWRVIHDHTSSDPPPAP
jgi:ketosteroid isomerase-like protein